MTKKSLFFYVWITFIGSLFLMGLYGEYGQRSNRYNQMNLSCINQPPAWPLVNHLLTKKNYVAPSNSCSVADQRSCGLGTDSAGRDILSRLLRSFSNFFFPALITVFVSLLGGLLLGIVKGYGESKSWQVVAGLVSDVIETIPGFLWVLFLIALFKPSVFLLLLTVGFLNIPKFGALVAEKLIYFKQHDFVLVLKQQGASFFRIVFKHILWRNCRSLFFLQVNLSFIQALIYETSLSYLGIGIQEPHPSYGNMVAQGKDYFFRGEYWMASLPALVIMGLTLIFFLFSAHFTHEKIK